MLLIVLILAAVVSVGAVVLVNWPGLRQTFRIARVHPGYEWLHGALETADMSAEAILRQSRDSSRHAAAAMLEQAILYSRRNALRAGAEPLPPRVRTVLAPYFPDEALDAIRWTLAREDLDLGSVIAAWYGREGGAVTLDDTIVFSDRQTAENMILWAHEITHVLQYEQLGVAAFARLYAINPALLEQQAWSNARRLAQELRSKAAAHGLPQDPPGTCFPEER